MWLLKFHEHQEFHHFAISKRPSSLIHHVRSMYVDDKVEIVPFQPFFQIFVNGDEVGFIGEVEEIE